MTLPAAAPAMASAASGERTRVMIVDDSAVVRGLFTRWVGGEADIVLAGSCADGAQALSRLSELDPDVVVLDIEMPVMGGLEALPRLLAAKPGLRVVMASTLSQKGAEVTFRALDLGASDYIGKPEAKRLGGADDYRRELLAKIRALAPRRSARRAGATAASPSAPPALRPLPSPLKRPEVLAVAASTGGPQALRDFFAALDGAWTAPVVVIQHMPPVFTTLLAEQLGRVSALPAVEAAHGMPLLPGRIHVAPGDHHLSVRRTGGLPELALDRGAPENFCRPAADPLFRSLAEVFGDRVLAAVLTGMGQDGCAGARAIADRGGVVLAQDEASSVVWGMPGAVAGAGLASLLAPVPELARVARALGRGERPGSAS